MKTVKTQTDHAVSPLAAVDFVDSYRRDVSGTLTAEQAAERIMQNPPAWLNTLMALRGVIVAPFGLKHAQKQFGDVARFIGYFPVLELSDTRAVLGADDKHLDFRITVETKNIESGTRIVVSTWVKTNGVFGRAYLALVLPVHTRAVPAMMNRLVQRPQ